MTTVIRAVHVFDGTGAPPTSPIDVVLDGGRITGMGPDLATDADATVIEADGLALMPGIIDTHTHYDAQVTWDPTLAPSPALGVTSVVIGNCGFTIAPCRAGDRDRVMKNLTQVEGMALDVLRAGIQWHFESFPEYLDALEAAGTVANVAALFGHSALRTYVMGEAATERAARDDEIASMAALVAEAMAAGAAGFASSTAPQHNGWGGIPMPSRLADDRELSTLIGAMAASGRGVFMLTKGDTTTIPYLETLAARSGRPIVVAALLHNPVDPGGTFRDLTAIGEARDHGRELWGQISCCPLTMDFTLASAYPLESLRSWMPAMAVRGEALKRMLADPAFRQRVRDDLDQPPGVRLFNGEWDKIELTTARDAAHQRFEHRPLSEVAAEAGQHPLDWMLDMAIAEDLESVFTATLLNADEDAVGRMIRDPNATVALSDAGAHLTFFCDAGFGLHLIGHWARERGEISIAQAIHELTAKPAAIYRIPGRGRIARGFAADLVLFDPEHIGRGPKRRVHDLPAGGARLTTDGIGIHGVWVNGHRTVDRDGKLIDGTRPGRVLRKFDS